MLLDHDSQSHETNDDSFLLVEQPPIEPYRDPVPAVVQPQRSVIQQLCQQYGGEEEG